MFVTKKVRQEIADNKQNQLILENKLVETELRLSKQTDRLATKVSIDLDQAVCHIEETLTKKLKQLELFKEGEEILGDNAFGFAIIQQLVKRAFRQEEELYREKKKVLSEKEKELKVRELAVSQKKCFGQITVDEANRTLQDLDDEYHRLNRKISNDGDENEIKANQIKHTLEFIKKWIIKKPKES